MPKSRPPRRSRRAPARMPRPSRRAGPPGFGLRINPYTAEEQRDEVWLFMSRARRATGWTRRAGWLIVGVPAVFALVLLLGELASLL